MAVIDSNTKWITVGGKHIPIDEDAPGGGTSGKSETKPDTKPEAKTSSDKPAAQSGRKVETPEEAKARTERVMGKLPQVHAALPTLRQKVEADLHGSDAQKQRVAAAVVKIMDATTMRVGSEKYATKSQRGDAGQDSFGASSLRKEHVDVDGNTVKFSFPGKSRKTWQREISDPALAAAVRHLKSLPGDRLMQYHDGKGALKPFTETHAREYMGEHGMTPKNLRTYHATQLATHLLGEKGPPRSEQEARANINAVVAQVSEHLGNTPAICRSNYINPVVLEDYAKQVPKIAAMSAVFVKVARRDDSDVDFAHYLAELQSRVESGELTGRDPFPEDREKADDDEDGEPDEPVKMSDSAFFTDTASRRVEGGYAVYPNTLLFRAGDYPEKQFSMSPDELKARAQSWQPVLGNVQHTDFLKGRAGRIDKAWTPDDGQTLFGEVKIPLGLDEQLSENERKLSMEWNRFGKFEEGFALVTNPHISDAVLMSMDTTTEMTLARPDRAGKGALNMSWLIGLFSRLQEKGVVSEEEAAQFAKAAEDEQKAQEKAQEKPADFSQSDAYKNMQKEIDDLRNDGIAKDAEACYQAAFTAGKVYPAEKAAFIANYTQAAKDDRANPTTVNFSVGTEQKTGSRVDALMAQVASRPSHALFGEQLPGTDAKQYAALFNQTTTSDPAKDGYEEGKALAASLNKNGKGN